MSRPRLILTIAAADVPRAEALLSLAGAETIALRDAADDPVLEPAPSTAPLWPSVTVEALFAAGADIAPLRAVLEAAFPGTAVTADALSEAAWQTGLQQAVQARAIGERLWLAPADDERTPAGRAVVRIHMGLAFGTGAHPTTALCLEWLERESLHGATLLDYGCGSGVLAIAALKLGAARALGVDNDPQALAASTDNAARNGVAAQLALHAPATLPPAAADVLVANILAGPLAELAPTFAARLRPGAPFALSGILAGQEHELLARYAACGFVGLTVSMREDWVRIAGRRG